MPNTDRFVDYYDLLGITPNVAADAIRTAIKEKRRTWNTKQNHPDPSTRSHAEQAMRDINDAERVLLTPTSKSAYDRERPQRLAAAQASIPSQVTVGDWEERFEFFVDNDNMHAAHTIAVEAVSANPGSSKAWTLRGQASALLENYRDAEYELLEASRLDPDEGYPHYLLAEAYRCQSKYDQALAQFDKALSLDPANPVTITSKAEVYLETNRPAQAVVLMEPIVKQFPKDEVYQFHLAIAYHDQAIAQLTPVPGTDKHIWTSAEQVAMLRRAADRIIGLNSTSTEVRKAANELRTFADEGDKMEWDMNKPAFYVIVGAWIFIAMCGGLGSAMHSYVGGFFLGLLIAGGVTYGLLYAFRRKPAWKIANQALGKGNLSQRLDSVAGSVYRFFSS